MLLYHYFINIVDIYQIVTPFIYPIAMIAQTSSVYITIVITMERYIVVCLPLESRSICTYTRSKRYVLLVLLISTLYNIPRFFEYEFQVVQVDPDNNPELTVTYLQSTQLRLNPLYIQVYVNWLYMIFMHALPFCFLTLANIMIGRTIAQARRQRKQMCSENQRVPNEESLSLMLMMIVIVFILCNSPAMVSNVMEWQNRNVLSLTEVSNLLVVINSSATIIIYSTFSQKFRVNFYRVIRLRSNRMSVISRTEPAFNKGLVNAAERGETLLPDSFQKKSVRSAKSYPPENVGAVSCP